MTLGQRIKTLRKALGLSQEQLAERIGIHQGSLSELERGRTKKGFGETIVKLATALHTNPEWLVTGKGSPTPSVQNDVDESEVLAIYRALPSPLRDAWMASGRAMLAQQPTSQANPYKLSKAK